MDSKALKFNEGDRVIYHFGIKGEFLQEAVVAKVHRTGNFKINRSDAQFRQTGWEASEEGIWGQEWVEPWTPDGALRVVRHNLQVRVIAAANVLLQNLEFVEVERLENIALYLEQSNRKTRGE